MSSIVDQDMKTERHDLMHIAVTSGSTSALYNRTPTITLLTAEHLTTALAAKPLVAVITTQIA